MTAPPAGGPVVAGSTLIVPLGGPLHKGAIAAHRMSDGALIWSTGLAAEQPLAADADRVYISSGDALHALTVATGAVAWQVPGGGPLTAPPLAHAGWVVAAAAGALFAVRAADGVVVWRRQLGAIEFRPSLDGDLLVVSLVEGRVLALDLRDGATRWDTPLGSSPAEPLVIGGSVYVGTKDKGFYTLHASSGHVDTYRKVGAELRGRASVDDRHVYVAAMDNMLRAFDRRHGGLQWKQGLPYRPASGPVLIGTLVLVPGYGDAPLQSFAAGTGSLEGTVAVGAVVLNLPVFTNMPDGRPAMAVITGGKSGLEDRWTLSLRATSRVPKIPLAALTVLPGELVPLPQPPGR